MTLAHTSRAKLHIKCYNMTTMNRDEFERLVAEALDALPENFREKLDNVEVVIEDWPDAETMRLAGVRHRADLLGFYHGVPQTHPTMAWSCPTRSASTNVPLSCAVAQWKKHAGLSIESSGMKWRIIWTG